MVIGLSGVAGSGKDTFFELLAESMACKRVSLGDTLKEEVYDWTLKHYQINSLECSRQDKEKIRPFLVFHGGRKRAQTSGRYWIDLTDKRIARNALDYTTVITDIRYDDYENDELDWLRNELGGTLVHISQWQWFTDDKEGAKIKKYVPPANDDEARNDPKIKSKADYIFEAEKINGSEQDVKEALRPKIKEFVEWIKGA